MNDWLRILSSGCHPPSAGEPPRINPRAQLFTANKVPPVVAAVGEGSDRPEETSLLHEELLRLAVDSLVDADGLDPLPVHIYAIWFFARPIVMQRAGDSDRHVRAVWYRQGGSMWRIRTYVAGVADPARPMSNRSGRSWPAACHSSRSGMTPDRR